MTLEQAQIFFYISIPICLLLITITMVIGRIAVYGKASRILSKILKGMEEVEEKIEVFKVVIKELKEKFSDLKFYMKTAEEFKDNINDIKENFEETFEQEPKKAKKTKKKKKSSK